VLSVLVSFLRLSKSYHSVQGGKKSIDQQELGRKLRASGSVRDFGDKRRTIAKARDIGLKLPYPAILKEMGFRLMI
jgi:hypothetical protein